MDPKRPPGQSTEPCAQKHGITLQHQKLAALCKTLRDSLAAGGTDDCVAIASQLQLALHSHFTVEESVLFPALRAERPELHAQIASLEDEHESFRLQLDQLLFCIGATSHAQAASVLSGLRSRLDGHEAREEEFLVTESEDPPP